MEELSLDALARSTHFSTQIEGNKLDLDRALDAALGELIPEDDAERELLGCADAISITRNMQDAGDELWTPETIRTVHRALMCELGDEALRGEWRPGMVAISDPIRGPRPIGVDPEDVPAAMKELCEWVRMTREDSVEWPGLIVAGIIHYNITHIHPFADGNGRLARLLAAAVLRERDLAPGNLFNLDRYYAEDPPAYYAALRSVEENTFKLAEWIHYFLGGVVDEYRRVRVALGKAPSVL